MQHLWKKRWRLIGSIAVAVVAVVLLVAAVEVNDNKVCRGIVVEIDGTTNNFFVDEKEVIELINAAESVKGQKLQDINLDVLEDRLRKDKWISDAELFFDKNQVLQVRVVENEPVARIFTSSGNSFYIDSACKQLPLSKSLSARVPMFTSFPSNRLRLSKPDSALMASVKDLAVFIQADEFWNAQVAQVDITPNGFEMIPTVGNHVVVLGKGEDIQEKFDRLFSFYKQVWTKVGLAAYEKIDVQFDGQVVVTKNGAGAGNIDSLKAKEALEVLLTNMKRNNEEVVANAKPSITENIKRQSTISGSSTIRPNQKAEEKKLDINKEAQKKIVEKKMPKAVMEKKQ